VVAIVTPEPRGVARPAVRYGVPILLGVTAAFGWWWSARMAADMRGTSQASNMRTDTIGTGAMAMTSGEFGVVAFLAAWLAMMVAMMLPAVTPVVKLFARAAVRGRVAPVPYFVTGYLAVWTALGVPAYIAWKWLETPLADRATWVGRMAGGAVGIAGIWQLTPLKARCLRHCRSPLSVFLRNGRRLERPGGAATMGARHGLYCLGCCWAMFALLVAIGTMNLAWMLLLTALIVSEKTFAHGEQIAKLAAVVFVALGLVLLASPSTLYRIT
jgi:predicted metal-binding membrane protein